MKAATIKLGHVLCAVVAGGFLSGSLAAQDSQALEPRIGKLESEMHAVQRKVFPGGSPKYFQPEVQTPASVDAVPATPITSCVGVAELQVRIQDVEKQLAEITGRVEQNENHTKQLEDQFTKFKADVELRLPAGVATQPDAGAAAGALQATQPPQPVIQKNGKVVSPVATAKPVSVKTPAAKPVATPTTGIGDAETAYRAGYATYVAKDYDQSETAFKDFMSRYPQHPLASNVEFWLGRTYISKKQYGQAARSFLQGYQKYPKGEKAPDSLLGLAESLIALDKPQDACSALSELSVVYPDTNAAVKTRQTSLRTKAKCK